MIAEIFLRALNRLSIVIFVNLCWIFFHPVRMLLYKGHIYISFWIIIVKKWLRESILVVLYNVLKLNNTCFLYRDLWIKNILLYLIFKLLCPIIIICYHFIKKIKHVRKIQSLKNKWDNTSNRSGMWISLSIKINVYRLTKHVMVSGNLSKLLLAALGHFVMKRYIYEFIFDADN